MGTSPWGLGEKVNCRGQVEGRRGMPVWLGYHNGPSPYISVLQLPHLHSKGLVPSFRKGTVNARTALGIRRVDRTGEQVDDWQHTTEHGQQDSPRGAWRHGSDRTAPLLQAQSSWNEEKTPHHSQYGLRLSTPTHSPGLRFSFASSRKPPNTADCQIPGGSSQPGLPNPWGSLAD